MMKIIAFLKKNIKTVFSIRLKPPHTVFQTINQRISHIDEYNVESTTANLHHHIGIPPNEIRTGSFPLIERGQAVEPGVPQAQVERPPQIISRQNQQTTSRKLEGSAKVELHFSEACSLNAVLRVADKDDFEAGISFTYSGDTYRSDGRIPASVIPNSNTKLQKSDVISKDNDNLTNNLELKPNFENNLMILAEGDDFNTNNRVDFATQIESNVPSSLEPLLKVLQETSQNYLKYLAIQDIGMNIIQVKAQESRLMIVPFLVCILIYKRFLYSAAINPKKQIDSLYNIPISSRFLAEMRQGKFQLKKEEFFFQLWMVAPGFFITQDLFNREYLKINLNSKYKKFHNNPELFFYNFMWIRENFRDKDLLETINSMFWVFIGPVCYVAWFNFFSIIVLRFLDFSKQIHIPLPKLCEDAIWQLLMYVLLRYYLKIVGQLAQWLTQKVSPLSAPGNGVELFLEWLKPSVYRWFQPFYEKKENV